MKPKMIAKICVDIGMTIALLLLMPYELVGQAAHEWIGIGIFILFIVHHILNWKWSRNSLKGKYTPLRIWQTILVIFALVSMIGSMVSGAILSRHALSFLPISGGRSFGRSLHMLASYWGFVLLSLHLGLHWSMMIGMAKKAVKKPSAVRTWILRILSLAIAGYGVFAFVKREIGSYMLLRIQFVFFNFEEPLIFFLLDYAAVMGLFVFIGHYLTEILKYCSRKRQMQPADNKRFPD
ncbi:DUF4405 domain-containing protein [Dorea acetigenes]|jgi:hypothetical protein|uniref:DUF4405 domain-containing protein n=1 Tax=Dorea acetigenes TaxID=2981787 RepID=A0ABT2RQZ3_9FIRM|nr:DUF4405 domain-containing protein [Dorea acetigenes]MCB6416098.1 DUF4405 domain-containing protein [Faecalimonas umbilicata]MCU6687833.1 DUF4405 domain-containing protein [Dorea acetigenes]SCJ57581.1 Uncharacterised protein [uncultured Clostridium sp.]